MADGDGAACLPATLSPMAIAAGMGSIVGGIEGDSPLLCIIAGVVAAVSAALAMRGRAGMPDILRWMCLLGAVGGVSGTMLCATRLMVFAAASW